MSGEKPNKGMAIIRDGPVLPSETTAHKRIKKAIKPGDLLSLLEKKMKSRGPR